MIAYSIYTLNHDRFLYLQELLSMYLIHSPYLHTDFLQHDFMWLWYVDEATGREVFPSSSDCSFSQGVHHQFGGRSPGGAELLK